MTVFFTLCGKVQRPAQELMTEKNLLGGASPHLTSLLDLPDVPHPGSNRTPTKDFSLHSGHKTESTIVKNLSNIFSILLFWFLF